MKYKKIFTACNLAKADMEACISSASNFINNKGINRRWVRVCLNMQEI